MRRIPRPSPAMVVALVGVAIGLGGVAFATIPDSSGTIHGCYNNSGNLRVVESASDCRNSETPLAWNQQGPPGQGVRLLDELTLSNGESEVLFAEGALTLTAECLLDFSLPGADSARVFVSTTEDHSAYATEGTGRFDFSPATPKNDRIVFQSVASQGRPRIHSQAFKALTPGGTRFGGILYAGVNVLGLQDRCVFGGHVVVG